MHNLDEEICFCAHVTRRKLVNFIRTRNPQKPEQLSECLGAGTSCGFCRGMLRKVFEEAMGELVSPPQAPSVSSEKSL